MHISEIRCTCTSAHGCLEDRMSWLERSLSVVTLTLAGHAASNLQLSVCAAKKYKWHCLLTTKINSPITSWHTVLQFILLMKTIIVDCSSMWSKGLSDHHHRKSEVPLTGPPVTLVVDCNSLSLRSLSHLVCWDLVWLYATQFQAHDCRFLLYILAHHKRRDLSRASEPGLIENPSNQIEDAE